MGVKISVSPFGEPYHIGDSIELVAKTTAADGTATPPGAVLFREKNPVGEARLIGAENVAVGTYLAPITLNAPGVWYFRVECFGANAGADETVIHVRESAFLPL